MESGETNIEWASRRIRRHMVCSQLTPERKRGQQAALLLLFVPREHPSFLRDASIRA
jgi:hypothetical protein